MRILMPNPIGGGEHCDPLIKFLIQKKECAADLLCLQVPAAAEPDGKATRICSAGWLMLAHPGTPYSANSLAFF